MTHWRAQPRARNASQSKQTSKGHRRCRLLVGLWGGCRVLVAFFLRWPPSPPPAQAKARVRRWCGDLVVLHLPKFFALPSVRPEAASRSRIAHSAPHTNGTCHVGIVWLLRESANSVVSKLRVPPGDDTAWPAIADEGELRLSGAFGLSYRTLLVALAVA